ncbi:ABC-2 type transport system ATP-binding protein [Halobacillus karajensis]|uniref:ABC transporter ATP-binding protein YbhF n=1 Tax=Halobacillus karajensis TaxID=195088 RepID=A0A024P9E7_9BACI|nr:putative ABC transporter ATP-binding protein YbhF [Halobacillus karajensis]CDQ25047.1 putative ABC transporter ATP-binding protein YbhF [Halobacillus karajensis]CDQ28592.1 putative ABC transporter ATP-binding protein YbhF [Halobacillus karajensis]SEI11859.1 ABC-2 type transport system ATP-binding protein [Halobacillus karajensis]
MIPIEHVIKVNHLSKTFGETQAVKNLSFTVEKGEIFGIIGPNGAGKTTTLEILEGIQKASGGEVEVLGLHPVKQLRELNNRIGVQFQATSIQKKMKVKEAMDLFASFYKGKTQKNELIEMLGLQEKLDVRFEDLSGGWKQRVTLALATLHQPELLFLDEPSMGLDPHARRELWAMIRTLRDKGSTIVVTTHYMEEAEKLCDRVAMIYSGELKALNTPNELLDDVSTHYVRFESEEVSYDSLLSLGDVIKVEKEEHEFKVFSENLQQTAYQIFKYCDEEGMELRNFKFERGSLDDLFVQYLKKEKTG